MTDHTENIEAKLCAYLEGELAADQRAEIERHLATNPQHRKLMEELAGTRELLRSLPRERAPADMLETLQGQLERGLLLDDGPIPIAAGARGRGARVGWGWAQVGSLAAVLLLVVGLAMVVYKLLPPVRSSEMAMTERDRVAGAEGAPRATEQAEVDRFAQLDAAARDDAPLVVAENGSAFAEGRLEGMGNEVAMEVGRSEVSVGESLALAPDLGEREGIWNFALLGLDGYADRLEDAALTDRLFEVAGPSVGDNALFVVVSTADPSLVRRQVSEYFAANFIAYETAGGRGMPESLRIGEQQRVMAARRQMTTSELEDGAARETRDDFGGGYLRGEGGAAPMEAVEELIVAKQMTRAQVAELNQALNRPLTNQRAAVYEKTAVTAEQQRHMSQQVVRGTRAPDRQSLRTPLVSAEEVFEEAVRLKALAMQMDDRADFPQMAAPGDELQMQNGRDVVDIRLRGGGEEAQSEVERLEMRRAARARDAEGADPYSSQSAAPRTDEADRDIRYETESPPAAFVDDSRMTRLRHRPAPDDEAMDVVIVLKADPRQRANTDAPIAEPAAPAEAENE